MFQSTKQMTIPTEEYDTYTEVVADRPMNSWIDFPTKICGKAKHDRLNIQRVFIPSRNHQLI